MSPLSAPPSGSGKGERTGQEGASVHPALGLVRRSVPLSGGFAEVRRPRTLALARAHHTSLMAVRLLPDVEGGLGARTLHAASLSDGDFGIIWTLRESRGNDPSQKLSNNGQHFIVFTMC